VAKIWVHAEGDLEVGVKQAWD